MAGLVAACVVAAPAGARPSHHAAAHRASVLDFSWSAHGTITTPFTS